MNGKKARFAACPMSDSLPLATVIPSSDGAPISYRSLGSGEAVVLVGGALRRSDDYMSLARALARSFTVHVVDRRGRGESAAQGTNYGIEIECEDLLAVQEATGARYAFGHSYGGLVCLESALRKAGFDGVAVFEPGVSIDGCFPTSWLPQFRTLLNRGDDWGAMVCMVQGSGFAPRMIADAPQWLARLLLHGGIRRRDWAEMRPLLRAQLAEMEQVLKLEGAGDRYRCVGCPTLLMGGNASPAAITRYALETLSRVIPQNETVMFERVGHTGPDRQAPDLVAGRLEAFFLGLSPGAGIQAAHHKQV
ncbi:MAG TPA: alpha/beta hydrolase, partial [Phenylobacterium sp.]|nr:alpha/beta hydrolase [Phenylobacterium sp.]